MTVPAVHAWPTNGDLIEDVSRLYPILEGKVLDLTYGRGAFWTKVRPENMLTNDLHIDGTDFHYNFARTPLRGGAFDVVVFDPPYKLVGTPSLGDFDDRYGLDEPVTASDRLWANTKGLIEACRLSSRWVFMKCQDQVVSGRMVWQTFTAYEVAGEAGFRLVDRFDMLGGGRPQPSGRRQVHARGRGSTLLVFEEDS